jgi:hypothetical protein
MFLPSLRNLQSIVCKICSLIVHENKTPAAITKVFPVKIVLNSLENLHPKSNLNQIS